MKIQHLVDEQPLTEELVISEEFASLILTESVAEFAEIDVDDHIGDLRRRAEAARGKEPQQ